MLLQSVLLSLIIHLAFVTTYCLHLVFCVCRCGLEKRSNSEATLICIHKCHRLLQVACHYLLSHIVSPEKKLFLNHSKFGEADGRFLPLTLLFLSPQTMLITEKSDGDSVWKESWKAMLKSR